MKKVAFPILGLIAQRNILRCDLDTLVRDAVGLMERKKVSSIVANSAEGIQHIFSIEDMLDFVHDGGDCDLPLHKLPLRRITSLPEKERLLVVLEYMERTGVRHIGVLNDENELVGIATYSDILSSIDPDILLERKTVGELVARSKPLTFTADWILEDVMHHFRKIEDAIIVVEAGYPVGVVTTKDVFEIISSGQGISKPLSEFMTSPVITIGKTAGVNEALLLLKTHRIKRAVVVDDAGLLVGVTSQSELIGFTYGAWLHVLRNHTSELHELVEMLEIKAQKLDVLALTDTLTGLGNRRLLNQRLTEEIERITRYNAEPFALVIIDIDHFKRINDKYGHLVGDEVLQAMSAELTRIIRKTDVAVRWGGEEFAVLLSNTSVDSACDFIERYKQTTGKLVVNGEVTFTFSAGVGGYLQGESPNELFKRVDRALYRAKSNGRNRIERCEEA